MTTAERLAARARWCLIPCGFGLLLPLLNRLLPPSANTFAWLVDLAAHWQMLYAPLWLALCLLCAVRARRWLLLAPFALLPLWSASARLPHDDGIAPALIVVAANVHVGNRDPVPLVAWLRAQPADVVVISELTPEYAEALVRQLGDDYPHRVLSPRSSPFGIGIVSQRVLYRTSSATAAHKPWSRPSAQANARRGSLPRIRCRPWRPNGTASGIAY